MKNFEPRNLFSNKERFPNAFVDSEARIGTDVYIGAGAVIGKCDIRKGVYIAPLTEIGDYAVIHPNAVIGCNPFQFEPATATRFKPRSPKGRVIIDEFVYIGACTCIDRPAEENAATFIGKGTKIDNLCQIGHGVSIGRDCLISAHSSIGGNAVIGDRCIFNGQTAVSDHAVIPDGTCAVARAGLHGKAYKPYSVLAGSPAVPLNKFKSIYRNLLRLSFNGSGSQKESWIKRMLP